MSDICAQRGAKCDKPANKPVCMFVLPQSIKKRFEDVKPTKHEFLVFLVNKQLCFQDTGPIKHECDHNEIVAASNTVSDLLTHRKNSGSFLKSYYLLTYACSQVSYSCVCVCVFLKK